MNGGNTGSRSAAALRAPQASLADALRRHGPQVAGYALPFLLVFYVSLKGGGYDAIVRGEVGVAVWWIVLLGAAVGVLPTARVGAAGWISLGLLGAFGLWTALGVSWSESSERSVAELGRVAAYLGVLALALVTQGRDGLRRSVVAVGSAIAAIAFLALLSRLQPDWFPANETARFLEGVRSRLNYPLNYWNGLAALIAIGLPLVLWIATAARTALASTLAAAAVPAMGLAAFYTLSRGGVLELVVAVGVLLALHPRRLSLVPTLLATGAGTALLLAAAIQRPELSDSPASSAATAQGNEMLAIALVACAGVGLLQVAISLAARHGVGPRPRMSRGAAWSALAATTVTASVIALAAGVPGELSDSWGEFKRPVGPEANSTAERFESASGNGRYQYWSAALDANASAPLTGIGPGAFEFWWAREGTLPGFVRDAHSLYLETLGEAGMIGMALIGGFVLFVLAVGARRALTHREPAMRALFAAGVAGCAAFAVAAAVDWVWELPVIPIAFLLLAAGLVAQPQPEGTDPPRRGARYRVARPALIVLALASIAAIAIPLAGTASVRASQSEVNASAIPAALEKARTATELQPYAATPRLQEALVLELSGELDAAASAARKATDQEATNWRTWFVLSRIEAHRGEVDASIAAYRRARSLNPRSPLFQR